MSFENILTLWTDNQALSVVVWLFIIVLLMYLARTPAHQSIITSSRMLRGIMRIAAHSINKSEKKLQLRNREVLLAIGRDNAEALIEREFYRVNTVVSRDLSGYPNLHRKISDQSTRIDEDYQQSKEMPPAPPGWIDAVEAVSNLRTNDDSMKAKILEDIHTTVKKAQKTAEEDYRKASQKRQSLLHRILPYWRRMDQTLVEVNKSITGLQDRSEEIDKQMEKYEQILAKSPGAERMLSSSAFTQFFISGFVLSIATLGAIINYYLIAMPMSEMVGGNSMLGPFKASGVAAMVLILLEVAMGLFMMEAMRITHMFPVIHTMDDKMRRRMIWITFSFLFVLASVESSLAFMRDLLAADREALNQTLAGLAVVNPEFRWIPSMGQMVLGFILPFVLTFVAIPLESFVHSSRTVLGMALTGSLRVMSVSFRIMGNVFFQMGKMLVNLYDLFIFIPLRIEEMVHHEKDGEHHDKRHQDHKAF